MITISTNYTLKWVLDFNENYCFTECGKMINVKRGKIMKQIYNSGCIGYNIAGKFYSLTFLRSKIQKIVKINIPF